MGDRKATNAFKRAHVSFEEGMKCVESLYEKEVIDTESSEHFLLGKRGDAKVSKNYFCKSILRFLVCFCLSIYKGIKREITKSLEQNFKAESQILVTLF